MRSVRAVNSSFDERQTLNKQTHEQKPYCIKCVCICWKAVMATYVLTLTTSYFSQELALVIF